jgi:ABC-type uncharacterized transport system fused permease/ATPase subunit
MFWHFIAGAAFVVAVVYVYENWGKKKVETLLADLSSAAVRLERWADNKLVEVTDHLEEIALHKKHVDLKSADAARAQRIADKIKELLS